MFPLFKKDLADHSFGGYHRLFGITPRDIATLWFNERRMCPPAEYIDFLAEIGPGVFFGGALTIYPLLGESIKTVEIETRRLAAFSNEPLIGIGYDGTSESCFCVNGKGGKDGVCWFSWEEKVARPEASTFVDWIEAKPKELFRPATYAGYGKIKDIDRLISIMDQRAAFKLSLIDFDKRLQRPPDRPNDLLPRYNKLLVKIEKQRPTDLNLITVKVRRHGSKIADDNVEYVTIPVGDIPVNRSVERECYVFDPFNLPFEKLSIEYNPIIDLGSKMRVKYKELSGLLT